MSLIPDGGLLGLSAFHIYIIAGLLIFLFLVALLAVILLVCRARGVFSGPMDENRQSLKAENMYWTSGSQIPHRLSSTHSSQTRLGRHVYSAGGSLSSVPILAQNVGHHNHFGTHSSYRILPKSAATRRRVSLNSSAFGYPISVDDCSNPLLTSGIGGNVMNFPSKCGSNISDYGEPDDSLIGANSRLVLCQPAIPQGSVDQVPVMMMLSPLPPGLSNRENLLARCSPSSSVLFYGPNLPPSEPGTPKNHSNHSSQLMNMDGEPFVPSSFCLSSPQPHNSQFILGSQMALLGPGHPQIYLQSNSNSKQFIQMVPMRPNSMIGSDRLSLGSGSDRFSNHGSQIMIQPNNNGNSIINLGQYNNSCYAQIPAVTSQLHYYGQQQQQVWTPQSCSNSNNQFYLSNSMFANPQSGQMNTSNDLSSNKTNCLFQNSNSLAVNSSECSCVSTFVHTQDQTDSNSIQSDHQINSSNHLNSLSSNQNCSKPGNL